MGLSDRLETVAVALCLEDWAVIMNALATSGVAPIEQHRINSTIYRSAEQTARTLS